MNLRTLTAASEAEAAHASRVPGENGIWLFVLGDMLIYGLLFLLYARAHGQQPELFASSQAELGQGLGVFNTLVLLTSSWFVAKGVQTARGHPQAPAPAWFALAIACGVLFGISKVVEYSGKIGAGFVLTSNDFFMYYYVLTGFHFVHVLIGMVVLLFMWKVARAPLAGEQDVRFLECGGIFWHMVDLLWILIFPLLYLVG